MALTLSKDPNAAAAPPELPPSMTQSAATSFPRQPVGWSWVLASHPDRWSASVEAGRVLPDLLVLSRQDGVGGVGPRSESSGLITASRKLGRVVLDDYTVGAAAGVPSYCVPHVVDRNGGKCWLPGWCTPIVGSSAIKSDDKLHRAFLAHLVDSGAVPAPQEHVLRARRQDCEGHLLESQRAAMTDPAAAKRAKVYEAQLAIWDAALAPSEDIPTPSKSTRKRSPAPTLGD